MIKPNQFIEVVWNGNNKDYYESKGYIFTKFKDKFLVKAEDLANGSHNRIVVVCDFCGSEYSVAKYNYVKYLKHTNGQNACLNCRSLKAQSTCIERYGTKSPFSVDEFKAKGKQSLIDRYGVDNCMKVSKICDKQKESLKQNYGVDHPLDCPEIADKAKQTWQKNYGTDNPLKSPIVRNKIKKTLKEKYNVDNIMEIPEMRQKAKDTCVKKYGGESSQCSPEIKRKTWESMKQNGNIPTSKEERRIVNLLKEIYGEENCFPQFTLDKISFDCLLNIRNTSIDIEYDGWYWHKNKQDKDKKRDFYAMRRGYKVLRIKSKGKMPTKEQIMNGVEYLVNTSHLHCFIDLIDN